MAEMLTNLQQINTGLKVATREEGCGCKKIIKSLLKRQAVVEWVPYLGGPKLIV